MLPNEIYLQITNSDTGISFNSQIKAEIINQCGEVFKTFTIGCDFNYKEFYNSVTLKNQIVYEFSIDEDFYDELLILKLTNTFTNQSFFSVPFSCTLDNWEETARFEYKNESYFNGISYEKENYFQSIRLKCFKNDIDEEVDNEELLQLSGNKYYLRNVVTKVEKYKFYLADFFTYKRISTLLSHSIVYIDKLRKSTTPSALSKGERLEVSNLISIDFDVYPIEETLNIGDQLSIPQLLVTNLTIADDSNVSTISNHFTILFNKEIVITDNSLKFHLYKNGNLVESVSALASGKTLSANFTNDFSQTNTVQEYYILVDSGKISDICRKLVWGGITDATVWNFTVKEKIINPTTCDIPIINSVYEDSTTGHLIMDYTVTTNDLGTPEYEMSLNSLFTAIIYSRVGFNYVQQEITNTSATAYTSLYFRVRKHCTLEPFGTVPSEWSATYHWTNATPPIDNDYNPVCVIPSNLQTPILNDPQGLNNYSICSTGNQFTKSLKIDTILPQVGTQLLLFDGVTKAIPGNLSSFDGGGNGTNFNQFGIRWIRFTSSNPLVTNKIFDVNPLTGIVIGESTTYNCN